MNRVEFMMIKNLAGLRLKLTCEFTVRIRGKSFQFMQLNPRRSGNFFIVEKSVCKFKIVLSFFESSGGFKSHIPRHCF